VAYRVDWRFAVCGPLGSHNLIPLDLSLVLQGALIRRHPLRKIEGAPFIVGEDINRGATTSCASI
jgi:hypothetical protein